MFFLEQPWDSTTKSQSSEYTTEFHPNFLFLLTNGFKILSTLRRVDV